MLKKIWIFFPADTSTIVQLFDDDVFRDFPLDETIVSQLTMMKREVLNRSGMKVI